MDSLEVPQGFRRTKSSKSSPKGFLKIAREKVGRLSTLQKVSTDSIKIERIQHRFSKSLNEDPEIDDIHFPIVLSYLSKARGDF